MWDCLYFFAWGGARNSFFWPRACLTLRDSHHRCFPALSIAPEGPAFPWVEVNGWQMQSQQQAGSRMIKGPVSSYRGSRMTFPDLTPPHQRSKSWAALWGHIAKGRRVRAKRKRRELWAGCWTHVSAPESQFLCFALSLGVHFVLHPVLHFSLKPHPSRSSLSYIRVHQLSPSLNQAVVCLASRWGILSEYHSGVIASL